MQTGGYPVDFLHLHLRLGVPQLEPWDYCDASRSEWHPPMGEIRHRVSQLNQPPSKFNKNLTIRKDRCYSKYILGQSRLV
jgi:hypothetical protein